MAKKRTKVVREPVAYAEVGSYLHEGDGKAKIKTYTSVNKPLAVDESERTRRIGKIRVEMHVKESKELQDNAIYQKDVKMIQLSDNDSGKTEKIGEDYVPEQPDGTVRPGMDKTDYLKNFVDNIAADHRTTKVLLFVLGALAIIALVIAVVK
jgi:hypothetical protein